MSTQPPIRSADSAVGPLAGYLFQFEKALLLLSELVNTTEYVAIEEVDDVSTHEQDGTVLLTLQAKHSISSSGTTFEDTSTALWRTFEIWIDKLEGGTLTNKTTFVCCTNKAIPATSLLAQLKALKFDKAFEEIEKLLKQQQTKLKALQKNDPSAGSSIKETNRYIKKVIKKKDVFKIIHKNLSIADNETVREKFLNQLHLGSVQITPVQKERIYHEFYGWIISNSKARWMNGKEARLSKQSFDEKWHIIRTNPSIITAIFRTKVALGTITDNEILSRKKNLFVRQIEDIKRNKDAKARIIKEAILDFLYAEIELKHVVDKGDYTDKDFELFMDECRKAWQSVYDGKVLKEINEYSENEKNELAINIFDTIMKEVKIEFDEGFCFTTSNMYVKNGCFLKLSDAPTIGWHPEWEKKYKDEK